jgi:integrase
MGVKLTVRILEGLEVGESVRDTEARGLFAERGVRGVSLRWSDVLRRGERTGEARKPETIKVTLGTWPELSLERARAEALRLRAEVKAGRDPRGERAPSSTEWTLARLFAAWVEDGRKQGKASRTVEYAEDHYRNHLAHLGDVPLSGITRTLVRDEHDRITKERGPVAANTAYRDVRSAWNWASRKLDLGLGANPCHAITWNPIRPRTETLVLPEPGPWLARVREGTSPLRAVMHEFGLFSGLRPGNLVAIERAWVLRERKAILFPAEVMKRRRPFSLPLSAHMLRLIDQALRLGEPLYPQSPWLFPSRSRDGARVIATVEWTERAMPRLTGHIVRHMYSNAAARADVEGPDRRLLLAQTVPGIEGVYLNEPALFRRLLGLQEQVSAFLLREISASGSARRAAQ